MPLKPLRAALLAAGLVSLSPLAMARGDAVGLGTLSRGRQQGDSEARALNAAGQVGGESNTCDANGNYMGRHAFL